jgi:hypothetical protein
LNWVGGWNRAGEDEGNPSGSDQGRNDRVIGVRAKPNCGNDLQKQNQRRNGHAALASVSLLY